MYAYTCRKCQSGIGPDESGNCLVCKGCGERMIDASMVDIASYEPSAVCPRCGGGLESDTAGDRMECPYCDSTFFLSEYFETLGSQYDIIVPFSDASRESVLEKFYKACSSGFAPADPRRDMEILEVSNVYLPYYYYEVSCDVHYTVETCSTQTRSRYVGGKGGYVNERYTQWIPDSDSFSEAYGYWAQGFLDFASPVGSVDLSANSRNIKTLLKFSSEIMDWEQSSLPSKPYSPALLDGNEIIYPALTSAETWDYDGEFQLRKLIRRDIEQLYAGKARNIGFKSSHRIVSEHSELFPASFVSYRYGGKDRLMILDGIHGNTHCGAVPVSGKKVFLAIAQWLSLVSIIVGTELLFFAQDSQHIGPIRYGILAFGMALTMAVPLWLRKLRVSGSSKPTTRKLGLLSGILLTLLLVCSLIASAQTQAYREQEERELADLQEAYEVAKQPEAEPYTTVQNPSETNTNESNYTAGKEAEDRGDYITAIIYYERVGSYSDALVRIAACCYWQGEQYYSESRYKDAAFYYQRAGNFADAGEKLKSCRQH